MNLRRIGLISGALVVCLATSLLGQIPAVIPQGTKVSNPARNWLMGVEFAVTRPVTVVDLGRFDTNGNGHLDDPQAPQVGIWDVTSGQLLRSTTIALDAQLSNGAFYAPIEPLTLAAGHYIVGTQTFGNAEPVNFMSAPVQFLAGMEWVQGRYNNVNDLAFPSRRGFMSVAPAFRIDQPVLLNEPSRWSIVQRDDHRQGDIPLQGYVQPTADRVEARVIGADGSLSDWAEMQIGPNGFSGHLAAATGWNQVEVRAFSHGTLLGSDSVDQVGVGEIFVTAGQSNSANHGSPVQTPKSGNVVAMDETGRWRPAKDPQPIATGTGGSPWPLLGDLLSERWDVPVGFVSVGWGGTRVDEWLPGGSLYPRLQHALQQLGPQGARAVLWHQGESDAAIGTTADVYAARLERVIAQSRLDAGYSIPWGVAQAAFLPQNSVDQNAQVLLGQQRVIDDDPLVFAGPLTDDLLGPLWRWDAIHFNQAGLEEHARRWANALDAALVPEPMSSGALWLVGLLPGWAALRRGPRRAN